MKFSIDNNSDKSNELIKALFIIKYKKIKNKKAIAIFLLFISILYIYIVKQVPSFPENGYYKKFLNIFPKINNNETITNIENLFQSRELFINGNNITNEYIHFIRPINVQEENYTIKKYENTRPYEFWNKSRPNKYSKSEFYKLCLEKNSNNSLDIQKYKYSNEKLVSVIVKSHNKENDILKSIRSIQNQSLKNIEIIIIDDGSTDNSKEKYKYLLEIDPRIRIFYHLKNMGIWRTCLDGFLYSKSKYFIYFDMEDCYVDNYVLEDAYNLTEKYQLDSVRFSFIRSSNINDPYSHIEDQMKYSEKYKKIVYGERDFNVESFAYGPVWDRLTRANIFTKGLYLLDDYLLNVKKNLYEDRWINILINKMSFNLLMIDRPGYLYFYKKSGEGRVKSGDLERKFQNICEFINFWIFDLKMLPKDNNKKSVIKSLRTFNKINNKYFGVNVNLAHLYYRYIPYENLLISLIEDPFVINEDKKFLNNLYNKYKKNLLNNNKN